MFLLHDTTLTERKFKRLAIQWTQKSRWNFLRYGLNFERHKEQKRYLSSGN